MYTALHAGLSLCSDEDGGPQLTDTEVDLTLAKLDLHLSGPTWTFDQLERLAIVLLEELEQWREEVLSVPTYA